MQVKNVNMFFYFQNDDSQNVYKDFSNKFLKFNKLFNIINEDRQQTLLQNIYKGIKTTAESTKLLVNSELNIPGHN